MGDYRNTPTHTMQPSGSVQPMATVQPPRGKGTRLAIALVALLGAGLITFGIVAALRTKDTPAEVADPGSGSARAALADAAVIASTPVDAAPAPVPPADASSVGLAQSVPDATPAPKKDARSTHASEKRMGRLVVRAFPVLTVYVDNKKIHDTPVDMKLPVGKHRLRLVNSEVGKNETLTVTIDERKTTTIDR
jgi:hypothetical protein